MWAVLLNDELDLNQLQKFRRRPRFLKGGVFQGPEIADENRSTIPRNHTK
jgi:hypothetical protein